MRALLRLTDVAVQLPRAPGAAEAQAEAARQRGAAAAKSAYEAAVAAVRELRMALRDVATRLLCDRRWRSLALPVAPQDDPEYWERVSLNLHSILLVWVVPHCKAKRPSYAGTRPEPFNGQVCSGCVLCYM